MFDGLCDDATTSPVQGGPRRRVMQHAANAASLCGEGAGSPCPKGHRVPQVLRVAGVPVD